VLKACESFVKKYKKQCITKILTISEK
jgi:hypothetical protein